MNPVLDLRYIQLPRPEAVRSARELSTYEQAELRELKDRRRQPGWMAARWLIKRLMHERLEEPASRGWDPTSVSILSLDLKGRPTRPTIVSNDRLLGLGVSISHTTKGVLVGLSRRDGLLLGVDLAPIERAGLGKMDQWYTLTERRWIQQQADPTAAARIWTVKQAYYKAANRGEPFSPRRIEVSVDSTGLFRCDYSGRSHDLPAYIAVTTCDGHIAALVVILPEHLVSQVAETYDSIIPQSQLVRIGQKQEE